MRAVRGQRGHLDQSFHSTDEGLRPLGEFTELELLPRKECLHNTNTSFFSTQGAREAQRGVQVTQRHPGR